MKRELACLYVILVFMPIIALVKSPELGLVIAWALLFCGLIMMSIVISFGLSAKRSRMRPSPYTLVLSSHRVCVHLMTLFIIAGVVCIEISIRKIGGLWGNMWFVAFHLSLVAAMTVTFILARFRHTGIQSPDKHWKIVYPFAFFYTASFITGTILILEHFEKL
jgi:hypothetical protein